MAGSPTVSVLAMARSRLTPAAQAAQAAHSAAQSAVRAIYPGKKNTAENYVK